MIQARRALLAACGALLCVPAVTGAAYGPFGGVYAGHVTSNQGSQGLHPVELELTANGRSVKAFVTYWHTRPCAGSAGDFAGATVVNSAPVRRNGTFSSAVTFTEPNPDDRTQRLNHRAVLAGRVGAKRASGTYRDVITITNAAGSAVSTCDTGTASWSGRRGKGRFGGASAQEMPLAVSRTRSGKRASLFIQWRADCGGGTFLERALEHKGLRVRRGKFSKSGGLSFTTDKGARVTGTFSITGRFSGRRVAGRYTVNATGTSTSGQQFSCKLDRMPYKATRG